VVTVLDNVELKGSLNLLDVDWIKVAHLQSVPIVWGAHTLLPRQHFLSSNDRYSSNQRAQHFL
jgi:hypothetical protein